MEQRQRRNCVSKGISAFGSLICFCVIFTTNPAIAKKSKETFLPEILNHCVDGALESFDGIPIPKRSIFVLFTDRTCMPCYSALAEFFRSNYPDFQVNFIIIMKDEILKMESKAEHIQEYFGRFHEPYFFFFNKVLQHIEPSSYKGVVQVIRSPSPSFFIVDQKGVIYFYDYPQTSTMLNTTE